MSRPLFNSSSKQQSVWRQHLQRAACAVKNWIRRLIYSLIEIVILFTATAALVGILLSFVEAFWYLYLRTPVGIKYTADPSRSSVHLVSQLIQKDLFLFSVEIATATLAACLIMSAVCQLLAVRRYFYEGRGLLNRIIWLLLFSTAAAYILERNSQIDLPVAFGAAIAPCLCLVSSCHNISKRLLPELTPFAIIEMIISIKNAGVYPADRVKTKP